MGNADIVGDLRGLIVFDLDGTLIDSEGDLADAANALIAERGGPPLPREAIGGMVGDGAAMLVRRALDAAGFEFGPASLDRFLALYDERLLRTTRPYPGMVEALQTLHALAPQAAMAVLTNKPLAHTTRLLGALGLSPFFSSVIGGDGPFPRKPDPAGLRHLMSEHHAEARRTVLVGDSHIDAATAHAAAAHFCLARYGFGARAFHGQPVQASVQMPSELPDVIPQLLTT